MIYRTEHPDPQFERANWQCLNGSWEFEWDFSVSGTERGMFKKDAHFSEKINVPFCPESALSGIGRKDFLNGVWYRKTVSISPEALLGRVILHFGAVDYEATLYVNEQKAGTHRGGYVSFQFDITEYLHAGENILVLGAVDNTRSPLVPSGKQSMAYGSYGCLYTRTTGIWQTVWLEFVPQSHIKKVRYTTDVDNAVLTIAAELAGAGELIAEAFYEGRPVGTARLTSGGGSVQLSVPLTEKHLWQVGQGCLYDLQLTYSEDRVKSYFGLRAVTISGNRVQINGKNVFQRLILDQGFYPEGIYTAPEERDLSGDILRAMDMGFNGARLHQKVFEPRFLYHCDRLGYIVWGEYPSWGFDYTRKENIYGVLPEWLEVVERDFNHPAIITWCPFNETGDMERRKQSDDLLRLMYLATKAADPTRPCIDTSGYYHVMTDIYDLHDYEQDPAAFGAHYAKMSEDHDTTDFIMAFKEGQRYDGKLPFCVSEYGGIGWCGEEGWGYGSAPKTKEEYLYRLKTLTDALLDNENIFSLCYTQLTDVEQEQNGLYYYDRRPKFPPEIIRPIFARKAAIED